MTIAPESRRQLPMFGRTHGNRSPVTCQLRCGNACFHPVPNTSDNDYFRDIASAALSRRAVLGGGGAAALAIGAGAIGAEPAAARPGRGHSHLRFHPIKPVDDTYDNMTVPKGYDWHGIIRWGDPLFKDSPAFDVMAQTEKSQQSQFGYNCDYLDIIVSDKHGRRALLVANHEYTNEGIMFPPGTSKADIAKIGIAAHGMSVVELRRKGKGENWHYIQGGKRNRRITMTTPFTVSGPAAGSDLLKTKADPSGKKILGTLNNCSGGTTPWGTVLSGEENIHQYFWVSNPNAEQKRYGLSEQDERGWRNVDERFDLNKHPHEINRFGWIVEIDPNDPDSTPVKHTAMGRFKHEGANVIIAKNGHAVAYMGDDERFEYMYKFVSKRKYDGSGSHRAHAHNRRLLTEGDLYVGQFNGDGMADGISDGAGEWIPLTKDGKSMVKGFSLEQVLVFTRSAADKALGTNGKGPTKMDRPEDVEPNPHSGWIYGALTNNSQRGTAGKPGVDEANPRPENKDGHVIEIREDRDDHTSATFTWNLFLICGDEKSSGTYFGGYTGYVSPIACPDNVAFDSEGNLWVSTDGQPSAIKKNDGLFKVPTAGKERGRVQQFLAVPTEAETCGPVIHDRDGSVFVAVQHPGEDGSWEKQTSYFPDFAKANAKNVFAGPRPTVVQVTRKR